MEQFLETIAPAIDPVPMLKASRFRIGKALRAQGVPAILIGVSFVVLAAGAARALQSAAPALPDAFREGRSLWESIRRRPLNP
jgi:hypothetical protein